MLHETEQLRIKLIRIETIVQTTRKMAKIVCLLLSSIVILSIQDSNFIINELKVASTRRGEGTEFIEIKYASNEDGGNNIALDNMKIIGIDRKGL